ncbi:MAG: hypothetical protein ABIB71_08945 [Candidatus Woesearchaeota archaeon]
MPQKDFLGPMEKIEQTLVFDQKDLIKMMRIWFKDKGYTIWEKAHTQTPTNDGRNKFSMFWKVEKEVDPYVTINMDVFVLAITQDVTVEEEEKKVTMQDGKLSIDVGGYTTKDIESEWGISPKNPLTGFLRELYDKILNRDKMDRFEAQIRKDKDDFKRDLKTYMKMHRID